MKAGSTAWLLVHEARLQWRNLSGTSKRISIALLAVFGAILALAGIPLGYVLDRVEVETSQALVFGALAAAAFTFTLMLSQTLSAATESFYKRRDLDLLLSSPLPAARVLMVRCLGLALATGFLWLFVVTPPALTLAVMGQPRWLGLPLTVAALALWATATGLWLAMALFALLGPRRTRTLSQVVGAFTGAAFFLGFQAINWLPDRTREAAYDRLERVAGSDLFSPGSPLSWPARAAVGEPAPLLVFMAVSVAAFVSTTALLGRRFAENAAAANGREAGRVKPARGDAPAFSQGAFRATIKKEVRLMRRDPALMSQVLLRLLYMVPLLALLWRAGDDDAALNLAGLAAGVTFLAGQLAGSLARITVTTEDAPDLLSCAPAAPSLVRRAKLWAALLPVAALLVAPVAGLLVLQPQAGLVTALTCAGSATSSGLIILWMGKTIPRAQFNKQEGVGNIAANIADLVVGLLWGAAAYLGVRFGIAGLAPAAVALIALAVMRRPASGYAY